MAAITFESNFIQLQTQTEQAEKRWSLPSPATPRFIGRLTSATLIEYATEIHAAAQSTEHQQRMLVENVVELAIDDRNVGTNVNDSRVERLLDDFDGNILEASGYLLEVTAAIQADCR